MAKPEFLATDFFGSDFDPSVSHESLVGLNQSSGLLGLENPENLTGMVIIYGLSKGYTLDDIERMTPQEKQSLGSELLGFIRRCPTGEEIADYVPISRLESNQREYGIMYQKAMNAYMKEPWPEFDPDHPENMPEPAAKRLASLRAIGHAYQQTSGKVSQTWQFVNAHEDIDYLAKQEEQIQAVAEFADLALRRTEEAEPLETAENRYLYEAYQENFRGMAGKTVGEAHQILAKDGSAVALLAEKQAVKDAIAESDATTVQSYAQGGSTLFNAEKQSEVEQKAQREAQAEHSRAESEQKLRQSSFMTEKVMRKVKKTIEQEVHEHALIRQHDDYLDPERTTKVDEILPESVNDIERMKVIVEGRRMLDFVAEENRPLAEFMLFCLEDSAQYKKEQDRQVSTRMSVREAAMRSQEVIDELGAVGGSNATRTLYLNQENEHSQRIIQKGLTPQQLLCYSGSNIFEYLAGMRNAVFGDDLTPDLKKKMIGYLKFKQAEYPDPAVQKLDIEEIFETKALRPSMPHSLTMSFTENAYLNPESMISHMNEEEPAEHLSQMEEDYLVAIFDKAFPDYNSPEQREMRAVMGKADIFETIWIKSGPLNLPAKVLFGSKYSKGLSPEKWERMMKCEVAAAALKLDAEITVECFKESERFVGKKQSLNVALRESQKEVPSMGEDVLEEIFDRTFSDRNEYVSSDIKEYFRRSDCFHWIQIDGKRADELFSSKYADWPPERRDRMMKCEIVNAALQPGTEVVLEYTKKGENELQYKGISLLFDGTSVQRTENDIDQATISLNRTGRLYDMQPDVRKSHFQEAKSKFQLNPADGHHIFFPHLQDEMMDGTQMANFDAEAMVRSRRWSQDEADSYKSFKAITDAKLASTQMLSQGFGGMSKLAAMILMHDNPHIRFTDINGDQFSREKEEAGRRVLDAIENVSTQPEKLSQLLADAAVALANIDPKKEVLHALGKDENMSGDTAEAEMRKPENTAIVNEVLSGIAKMYVGADQAVKVVLGKQRSTAAPIEPNHVEEEGEIKTVYDGMRSRLSAKEWKEYMEASVRKDQQNMLQLFVRTSDFVLKGDSILAVELAAREQAISVIAHNGPLWSIPKEQTTEVFRAKIAAEKAGIQLDRNEMEERLAYGLNLQEREAVKREQEAINWKPEKPKELSGWVKFWSQFNFYQKEVAAYNREMARYKEILGLELDAESSTEREDRARQFMETEMERRQEAAAAAQAQSLNTPLQEVSMSAPEATVSEPKSDLVAEYEARLKAMLEEPDVDENWGPAPEATTSEPPASRKMDPAEFMDQKPKPAPKKERAKTMDDVEIRRPTLKQPDLKPKSREL